MNSHNYISLSSAEYTELEMDDKLPTDGLTGGIKTAWSEIKSGLITTLILLSPNCNYDLLEKHTMQNTSSGYAAGFQ